MTGPAFNLVNNTLQAMGRKVTQDGRGGVLAQCPAHDDGRPSLHVTDGDGGVLLYCFAGCPVDDVREALGLAKRDLFDDPEGARYRYDDGRIVRRTPDKRFSQSGNTKATPTLYRRAEVAQAVTDGRTVYLVEGEKDADNLRKLAHVTATTAPMGGGNFAKVDASPLTGADVVAVVDRDATGAKWARQVRDKLAGVASLRLVEAASGKDASDHLAAGLGVGDFLDHEDALDGHGDVLTASGRPAVAPLTLDTLHATFRRWLGPEYDLDAIDATLAAAAVERLDGDPLWLLIVSGSGNAKTETVQALDGAQATITSTISSTGALLSATSQKERAKDATGGLLRKIGDRGLLVIKDVTSILSMSRDARAEVLGALREVYDGRWSRNVGTDGGRTLDWRGRIVVVGAVTTAWDTAHSVIASMGDRFVLLRMDSTQGRREAGRRAIGNTGSEEQMRAELAAAVAGVLAGMNRTPVELTEDETERLLAAADLVTLSRTAVEFDYQGNVIDSHAPEMPTRFAKQLAQVVRGSVAIGIPRDAALRLAVRCARDSMPPLRLAIVDDLAAYPDSTTQDVRRRVGKPRNTVDRQLQALHQLGVIECDEEESQFAGKSVTRWRYRLATGQDPDVLNLVSLSRNGFTPTYPHKKSGDDGDHGTDGLPIPPAKSGQGEPAEDAPPESPGSHLVASLAGLPGRCPSCGWHTETQGHEPGCEGPR